MTKTNTTQRDQDEKKVLSELINNSKENIDVIAKRCGFSRQKVYKTIKQMEKNKMIFGYTAIFDEQKIGLNHYILLMK
jgi:DNA-binding Lrp family transcriptional regulator